MKNKILIMIALLNFIVILIYLRSNTGLKSLENAVSDIVLPKSIEKIAIKSDIGDSGGNGDYSITFNELTNIEDYTDYYFIEFVE